MFVSSDNPLVLEDRADVALMAFQEPDAVDAEGGRPQNFLPYTTRRRCDALARPQTPPQRGNAVREGDQPRGAPGYALKGLRRSIERQRKRRPHVGPPHVALRRHLAVGLHPKTLRALEAAAEERPRVRAVAPDNGPILRVARDLDLRDATVRTRRGAVIINVNLHAIDATSARWRVEIGRRIPPRTSTTAARGPRPPK